MSPTHTLLLGLTALLLPQAFSASVPANAGVGLTNAIGANPLPPSRPSRYDIPDTTLSTYPSKSLPSPSLQTHRLTSSPPPLSDRAHPPPRPPAPFPPLRPRLPRRRPNRPRHRRPGPRPRRPPPPPRLVLHHLRHHRRRLPPLPQARHLCPAIRRAQGPRAPADGARWGRRGQGGRLDT